MCTYSYLISYRKFLERAADELKMTAGNFYINDKSTGSVVGQQPFGGARLSGKSSIKYYFNCVCYFYLILGTNDKAGGPHYVLRWGNPQAVKETFVPLKDISYPYMSQ